MNYFENNLDIFKLSQLKFTKMIYKKQFPGKNIFDGVIKTKTNKNKLYSILKKLERKNILILILFIIFSICGKIFLKDDIFIYTSLLSCSLNLSLQIFMHLKKKISTLMLIFLTHIIYFHGYFFLIFHILLILFNFEIYFPGTEINKRDLYYSKITTFFLFISNFVFYLMIFNVNLIILVFFQLCSFGLIFFMMIYINDYIYFFDIFCLIILILFSNFVKRFREVEKNIDYTFSSLILEIYDYTNKLLKNFGVKNLVFRNSKLFKSNFSNKSKIMFEKNLIIQNKKVDSYNNSIINTNVNNNSDSNLLSKKNDDFLYEEFEFLSNLIIKNESKQEQLNKNIKIDTIKNKVSSKSNNDFKSFESNLKNQYLINNNNDLNDNNIIINNSGKYSYLNNKKPLTENKMNYIVENNEKTQTKFGYRGSNIEIINFSKDFSLNNSLNFSENPVNLKKSSKNMVKIPYDDISNQDNKDFKTLPRKSFCAGDRPNLSFEINNSDTIRIKNNHIKNSVPNSPHKQNINKKENKSSKFQKIVEEITNSSDENKNKINIEKDTYNIKYSNLAYRENNISENTEKEGNIITIEEKKNKTQLIENKIDINLLYIIKSMINNENNFNSNNKYDLALKNKKNLSSKNIYINNTDKSTTNSNKINKFLNYEFLDTFYDTSNRNYYDVHYKYFKKSNYNYLDIILIEQNISNNYFCSNANIESLNEKSYNIKDSNNKNFNQINSNQKLELTSKLGKFLHEFKTPLTSVIGLINSLEKIDLDNMNLKMIKKKIYQENITFLKSLADYVLFLINDSTHLIKLLNQQDFRFVLNFSEIKISEFLNFNLGILRALLNSNDTKKSIKPLLRLDKNIDNLIIISDDIRLKQILVNFISNAVKFTKSGSIIIEGAIIKEIKKLRISIIDTGIGIKECDKTKLFKDFEMIKTEQNLNIFGSGLGLSISNYFANILNHAIFFKSQYGKGSCFGIEIDYNQFDKRHFSTKDKQIIRFSVSTNNNNSVLNKKIQKAHSNYNNLSMNKISNFSKDISMSKYTNSFFEDKKTNKYTDERFEFNYKVNINSDSRNEASLNRSNILKIIKDYGIPSNRDTGK